MKRIFAVILAAVLCMGLCTAALAADAPLLISPAPSAGVNVTVTIADAGELVLVQAPVCVADSDGDGVASINDALVAAHAAYYEGGAEGYAYYVGDYGIAMDTLWGVQNGGSYMYYVNNLMPMSLGEAVNEGDSIVAYGFADLEYWSDTYSFFDRSTAEVKAGDSIELTLSTPDWEGNVLPAAGAVIYVDGVATAAVTDENGKASVTFDKAGQYTVSAKSDTMTLVPPVCVVKAGFADVSSDHPYAEAIDKLVANGLLLPDEGNAYKPDEGAVRIDLVGYLWMLENAPVVNYAIGFEDVDSDLWYSDAVRWAASAGIIEGFSDTKCGPMDKLDRQQAAVILWRYAKYKGIDVSSGESNNILSYNDAFEIKDWAIPAMQWATAEGFLQNDPKGNIAPAVQFNRGQIARLVCDFAKLG